MAQLGGSGSASLLRFLSRCCLGLHHLKVQLGLLHLLPRWFTHLAGKLEMPISRWPQFFSVDLLIEPECPHDLVLASHRVKKPKRNAETSLSLMA